MAENKKVTLSFTLEHFIIAILVLALIAVGYTYLTQPEKFQQALRESSQGTGTEAAVQPVTNEEEASETITDIGTDVKALTNALNEIDQSIE